jgi:hypothetical protein
MSSEMPYPPEQIDHLLTLIREWTDGEDNGEWPAPPAYSEYRVGGQMRLDVLSRIGRAADDSCDIRMVEGVIEGGWSEFTVEHDYELEVWVYEGRRGQRVFKEDAYSHDGAMAAFLKWIAA